MPNQLIGVSMAKKKKSPSDIIYEIKDLLDDLELQVNQDDDYDDGSDEDLDDDLDDSEEE
jgi:hypothetical protein